MATRKAKVGTVPIDPAGRYVILASGLGPGDAERLHVTLKRWWESSAPFVIFDLQPGVTFRFERVEAEPPQADDSESEPHAGE